METVRLQSQAFTTTFKGRSNILRSETSVSKGFDPQTTTNPPKPYICQAIWDTGATNSCISKKIVDACDLKPISIAESHTANGISRRPVYLVNVLLRNNVGIPNLRVIEADIYGADMLIGMDIIAHGDFAITCPNGKTVFTFRIPSIACIDFVAESKNAQEPIRHDQAKISRNSPCLCGSGKKYKKCCGK